MDYIVPYFSYPTVFITVFMLFITLILIAGILKGFRYLYLVTYKHSPKLVTDVEENTSVYYEYDTALKKYVRNDTAIYDKNDPKIYKIDITGHILSF